MVESFGDAAQNGHVSRDALFQVAALAKSGRITLYDVCSCTAICHVGLPESYLLSSQLPCICASGRVLILIGAQSNEENKEVLDGEVSVGSKTVIHSAARLCHFLSSPHFDVM